MTVIVIFLMLALIVEAFIEYAKSIGEGVSKGEWKTAVTQLCSIAVALVLCFATGLDVFAFVGLEFAWPWLGVALTGVFISRGSNYASDFVKRLQNVKK
ncbi:MAG: hypothetical protein IKL13_06365 [Clostridia bacterium]|nr:hypothetical protein [Clostridia bacterium]